MSDRESMEYDVVIVWFDYRSNKPVQIPSTLRALLEGKGSAI